MPVNLWPDFEGAKIRTPKAVVEEAGGGLEKKTLGLVIFKQSSMAIRNDKVSVSYSLYVPRLVYLFPFMRIEFGVEASYPVRVIMDKMDDALAKDEDELKALLAKLFQAQSTVTTIERLMSLAGV